MFDKEPTVIFGALAEVVKAIIPTLIIFGIIQWTGDQVAQVMLLISVVVGSLTIMFTRSQVVPTERANEQIETAIKMPADSTLKEVLAENEKLNE